ncbi:MAG: serine/threonine protein kinase, partial [Myxococcales bacterium]|nr:serine/threonine protein kinase [Myxococcales bacterium]
MGAPPIEQLPTVPVGERAAVPGRTFAIGTKMGERYQLARFIAAGGMGEVYEAEDTELDVRVALKTLRPGLADDPEALARFRREIHVARAVTHPNVCRVFDLGVHEGPPRTPFLTMELVRGESLAERIAKQPPGRETARAILGQILAGLEAAHRAGVIHRDLTPANILLAKDGERVAITDFGIAVANADAAAAVTAGTPPYMAPEVLGGAPPTAASDLYSLGVVMFQLQTGRLPRVVRTFDEGKTVDFGTP